MRKALLARVPISARRHCRLSHSKNNTFCARSPLTVWLACAKTSDATSRPTMKAAGSTPSSNSDSPKSPCTRGSRNGTKPLSCELRLAQGKAARILLEQAIGFVSPDADYWARKGIPGCHSQARHRHHGLHSRRCWKLPLRTKSIAECRCYPENAVSKP